MLKANTGGLTLATVKKENGARLATPCKSWVLTQAMGRGCTLPTSKGYTDSAGKALISQSIFFPP